MSEHIACNVIRTPLNRFWSRPRSRSAGQAVASSLGRVPDRLFPPTTSDKRALRLVHADMGRVPGRKCIQFVRLTSTEGSLVHQVCQTRRGMKELSGCLTACAT